VANMTASAVMGPDSAEIMQASYFCLQYCTVTVECSVYHVSFFFLFFLFSQRGAPQRRTCGKHDGVGCDGLPLVPGSWYTARPPASQSEPRAPVSSGEAEETKVRMGQIAHPTTFLPPLLPLPPLKCSRPTLGSPPLCRGPQGAHASCILNQSPYPPLLSSPLLPAPLHSPKLQEPTFVPLASGVP